MPRPKKEQPEQAPEEKARADAHRPSAIELKKIAADFKRPHHERAQARFDLARWYGFTFRLPPPAQSADD